MYVCSIFSCVPYFSCVVVTLRRGALSSLAALQPLQHVFVIAAVSCFMLHVSCFMRWPFAPPFLCGRLCDPLPGTFGRTFVLKRLQRSFHTVFRAVLSGLIVHAYICTVCTV